MLKAILSTWSDSKYGRCTCNNSSDESISPARSTDAISRVIRPIPPWTIPRERSDISYTAFARPNTGPQSFGTTAASKRRAISCSSRARRRASRRRPACARSPRPRFDELPFTWKCPPAVWVWFWFGDQIFPYQEGIFANHIPGALHPKPDRAPNPALRNPYNTRPIPNRSPKPADLRLV
jgi:hypothetical protein